MEIRELIRGDFTPPVQIDVPVDQLFAQSLKQNFVPVVDDRQIFYWHCDTTIYYSIFNE